MGNLYVWCPQLMLDQHVIFPLCFLWWNGNCFCAASVPQCLVICQGIFPRHFRQSNFYLNRPLNCRNVWCSLRLFFSLNQITTHVPHHTFAEDSFVIKEAHQVFHEALNFLAVSALSKLALHVASALLGVCSKMRGSLLASVCAPPSVNRFLTWCSFSSSGLFPPVAAQESAHLTEHFSRVLHQFTPTGKSFCHSSRTHPLKHISSDSHDLVYIPFQMLILQLPLLWVMVSIFRECGEATRVAFQEEVIWSSLRGPFAHKVMMEGLQWRFQKHPPFHHSPLATWVGCSPISEYHSPILDDLIFFFFFFNSYPMA